MATASSAKTEVGTVKVVIGDVRVIGVDGVVRACCVGDKVYAREIIETTANAVVQIQLENGRLIDLGRNSQLALDDSVLGAGYPTVTAGPSADINVAEIQKLIAAGADPAQVAAAAAAGGVPGAGGENEGAHAPLVIDQVFSFGEVTSGYETKGIAIPAAIEPPVPLIAGPLGPIVSIRIPEDQPTLLPPGQRTDLGPDGVVVTPLGAQVLEGTAPNTRNIIFFLELDDPSATPIQVTYEIRPGSAGSPADFLGPLVGTVIFPAGTTRIEVPVSIVQDHLVEGNETFTIVIVSAVGADINLEANSAEITIIDDDAPPLASDDSYDIVRGRPNDLPSVLTRVDGGETVDDSGDGPFETLTVVAGPGDTPLPNGDVRIVTSQGGSVLMHPDGTFTYTPPAVLTVPDTFVYTMTDGFNGTSSATVTLTPNNEPATVRFNVLPADAQVNEAGLAIGSNPASNSEIIQGTFTISDPDGVADVVFATINGQDIFLTDLPGTVITTPVGVMTITAFNPVTGVASFTYELKVAVTDVANQPEQDIFTVTVTDNSESTSAPANLTIDIIDDLPVARPDTDAIAPGSFVPESGNVITGAGTTSGAPGADTLGADVPTTLTNIASTNVPGNVPAPGPNGVLIISGQYGVLNIAPNGDYTYTRNAGTPGGVVDVFRYTLTDGDGDLAPANLTINIGDDLPLLNVPGAGAPGTQVDEAGLPLRPGETPGSNEAANSETTAGAITFNAKDGPATVTIDGVPVSGVAGQTFAGLHGTLTVTGFIVDPVTGAGTLTYSYTLTDNTIGDATFDDFAVTVTDVDGDPASATLKIDIKDDVPAARNDTDSVAAGSFAPESGNVITATGTTSGAPGADTPGADNATLTNITSTNVPGNVPAPGPNGVLIISGQFGVLNIAPNGDYTYTRNAGTPGGVVDVFRYTLTDGDGDLAPANLTINIGDDLPLLNVPGAGAPGTQVDEAGLPLRPGETPGSNEAANSETTAGAITFNAKDGPATVTIDGVPVTGVAGQTFAGLHGTLTVTGFTVDPVTGAGTLTYSYTLTDNNLLGDASFDDFAVTVTDVDGDPASATLKIDIKDDVPAISVVAAPPNSLQVDETSLNQDATANFASFFSTVPGADGATTVYTLDVKTAGVDSGLVDVATGLPIVLVKNPVTGAIEGHVNDPNGALSFVLTVNPQTGDVTLDQILAVTHPNAADPDDEVSLGAADLIALKGTITDGDGDVRDAVLNLGDAISFKDDGPNIDPSNAPLPSLTVDETNLAQDATANFAANFTNSFGADGAGTLTYALDVGAVPSGLKDVATDADIVLSRNAAGQIEGRAGVGGPLAFTVTVAPNGDVTLDQLRALKHPDATNADDAVNLAAGSIVLSATSTDRDGDIDRANLNIGGALTFKDDGPNIDPSNAPLPSLTVDETNLAQDATANFAANFTNSFGADGAGTLTYALDVGAVPSGLKDVATDADIVLSRNAAGVIEGRAGVGGPLAFTVTVAPNGDVTLDQLRALKHPDATNADDAVNLAAGSIVLSATSTDRDGDIDRANLNIGGALTFKDDGPNIDPSNAPLPSLTVDETNLAQDATANFAANFTNSFGADGAGTLTYALDVGAVPSGLKDVATDADIVLSRNAAGVIEGRAGVGGPLAFTVTVAPNGDVTLDQLRALKHPDATNADDAVNLAAGSIVLSATSTDRDGDIDRANLNIGGALTFKDDGPNIDPSNAPLPSLTVDETNLAQDATANFAANFTNSFGADGAGTLTYALDVGAVPSGLKDVATDADIVLSRNAAGQIEGRAGVGGPLAFTVTVAPNGDVTLDQLRALKHPDATNADDAVNLAAGSIVLSATSTDRDGDIDRANLNIGGALTFKDDGPNIDPSNAPLPSLTVDETNLAQDATANFAANFTNSFGADGAGTLTYALDVGAVPSGLKDVATDADIVLSRNAAGQIEGRAGVGGPLAFTVTVAPNGDVTLDQLRALKHPDATNADDAVNLAAGSIVLSATSTDRDGDIDRANLNIGGALTFKDDGPNIDPSNAPLPSLTVDETNLAQDATANFAANFTNSFGADGAGTLTYALDVGAVPSGLKDVATDADIVLSRNAAGQIEGRAGVGGPLAFTVTVAPNGDVTLDQLRALKHPDATNADDAVNLAAGSIVLSATSTDRDGDIDRANLNIGGALTFKDDGPNIDPSNAPLPSLTVDETNLAQDATANFAANFTNSFGADGAGTLTYALDVGAVPSGLKDVATDADIVLSRNAAGQIEGRAGVGGPLAFTVTVAPNGDVTLDQLRALKHPDATNADDAVNLAAGSIVLSATSTDRDGDIDRANLNIGGALTFKDDGPNIDPSNAPLPSLTVDETNLAQDATANFAANFTNSFGADGAGTLTYALDVGAVPSGLKDVATDADIVLSRNAAGVIEGRAGVGGPLAFTVTVAPNGDVTLDQLRALKHPDATNADDAVNLAAGSIVLSATSTDRDGDIDRANLNIGGALTFKDDGPNIDPSNAPLPSLTVDETNLAQDATANFAANFTNSFGADGAGTLTYALDVGAVPSGLKDVATDADIVLSRNAAGVIEGRAGVGGPLAFTVTVAPNGDVTLDQLRALKHPDATNADDAVNLAAGSIVLSATSTDRDGDIDRANLNIGGALTFKDDGPNIDPSNAPLPSLTVDETNLAQDATANFAANFTNSFGADGAGTLTYALDVGAVPSGLKDVATDADIVLSRNAAGQIEGRAGVGGPLAFTVTVAPNGDVTLDQLRALKHPDATNADDAVNLAAGSIVLSATSTDRDGDIDRANLNIGGALTFKDDGPNIDPSNAPLPSLTVDETNLAQDATANFAANFTNSFGADGAGTLTYALDVGAVPSGLKDVATDADIVLSRNAAGVIEGRAGVGGPLAFTVTVAPNGDVTLDQLRALKHPDATNADDAVNLAAGSIVLSATSTDRDGDIDRANLNIGGALTFKDDGPNIDPSNAPLPSLTVDETNLAQDATANFAANFTNSFGADGAGTLTYALDVGAVPSGLKDVATDADIVLSRNAAGVIEGRAGVGGPLAFTVTVAPNGDVTLDQLRALKHPDATNADDAVNLAAGSIVLSATSTDRDGDIDRANLNIGGALTFKDDGPNIDPSNAPLPSLTVDETNLAQDATANFAANFTNSFGADGAGTLTYALDVGAVPSGLKDVATDADIVLSRNAAGVIEGRAGVGGPLAFTVTVAPNGDVTLDQLRALKHPDATNADDAVNLAAGSIVLSATSTDRDGDIDRANLNIGGALRFEDDGPNIDPSNAPLPSLTVDETNLAQDATANFAANFTNSFGADGAGTLTYALDVGAVPSGLKDVATDADIVLSRNAAGVIEGRAGVGGPLAFTVTVAPNGDVTLDQLRALKHPDATNADDAVNLAAGSIVLSATSTDRDGDIDRANLNIGGALTFEDDGPTILAGAVTGQADEDGLAGANIDAGRAGEVAGTGSATVSGAAGTLSALASFGADQAGSFGLGSDFSSLTAQNLASNGVALTYSVSGDTLTAKAGALDVFTLQITSAGGYAFTLKDQLDHPTLNGVAGDNTENAMDINFGGVVKVTDRDGDSVTPAASSFKITVQDDIPVATNITKSTALEVGAVTNLTLVLDVSGSMATQVTIGGQVVTRLQAEKQSAKALIDEYAALGPVKVTVVTFAAGSTALGYWMDANAAKAAIDGISAPNGTTNYTAGLNNAKLGYDGAAPHNGLLANAQDVLYFLSDGVPNPTNTGLDTPAEVTAWESFLRGSAGAGNALGEKITAFSLGMGPDVAATQLNPIAYNGVTNTDTNAIIVSDFSQLTQTLLATVQFQPVAGNLITDPNPDASYGADAVGWVQVLNVDGKTYVYDQKTDSTAGSTGTNGTFDTVTNQWTITTSNGGKIVVDMDDASYVYTPPANIAGAKVENIGFTLTDTDGDTASANLRINVEGPTLVVGQNVNDQPGQTTPHKVDPVPGATGVIGGGGSNDVLIGDVGGGSLVGKKTNVILILDTSGSMGETFGKDTASRLQGLKDGVNGMIDSLKASGATDVRVHINHFATTVEAGTKGAQTFDLVVNGVVQTAQVAAAHSFVNSFTASGFTNYEAGLQEALTWVNGPNELTGPNVVNQAIFVSDGEPNRALTGDSTNLGSVVNFSDNTTGWNQAMNQVLGAPGSGDTVNEITEMETQFGQMQAIGMGLNADAIARLTLLEGAGGAATNTNNAVEFKNELANVSPASSLGAVGNDIITGGAGGDIIYGDSVNTDVLAAARGLNLPSGSGWAVFEALEAGAGWTRTDTINYIRSHQDELAVESTGTGETKRTGGNDTIEGGVGSDRIYGQEGNDIISGGAGNDILSGGSGADTFKWGSGDQGTGAAPATDTVTDFNAATTAANKDVLDLRDLLQGENAGNLSTYLSFSQTGADVTLSVHSTGAAGPIDQKIVLEGVTMAQLAGANSPDSAGVIANLLANNKLITD